MIKRVFTYVENERTRLLSRTMGNKRNNQGHRSCIGLECPDLINDEVLPSSSQIRNQTVLVTGDNGFVGRRLVERILRQGNRVIGIGLKHDLDWNTQRYQAVDRDLTNPNGLQLEIPPDYVFHVAALTRATDPQKLTAINTAMCHNLVEACLQYKSVKRLVFVSSISACGPQRGGRPLTEQVELRPVSEYGKSKVACENLFRSFADRVPVSIVRPPIVLGQGDQVGLKMFQCIAKWHRHFLAGSDRDFALVHVDDLVEGLLLVAEKGEVVQQNEHSSGVYLVATQDAIEYSKLGMLIANLLDVPCLRVTSIASVILRAMGCFNDVVSRFSGRVSVLNSDKVRDSLAGSWSVDSNKIRRQLGFQPAKPLGERLKETIAWYRANELLRAATEKKEAQADAEL